MESVSCLGNSLPLDDFIREWMAFRELHKKDRLDFVFKEDGGDTRNADRAGWNLGAWGREKKYRTRMAADPWSFHQGWGWLGDLVVKGEGIVRPGDLVRALAKEVGASDISSHFLPGDVQHWAAKYREDSLKARAWKY